jgi:Holliday junction resolvase
MPNKNYIRGVAIERKCMEMLDKEGYFCIRSAGSHGLADIVAIDLNFVRLIQLKRTKKNNAHNIIRTDKGIKEFSNLLVPINCRKEVWVWTDQKGFKVFNCSDLDSVLSRDL